MSNAPVSPGPVGVPHVPGGSGSYRAALLAGGIAVALLAVVLIAHAARGTKAAPSSTAAAMTTTTSASSMGGMSMSGASAMPASGVMTIKQTALPMMQSSGAMPTAMAMVPLGSASWEGMSIEARTSAPATFELFNGTSQQLVKPTAKTSFHLMVLLSDKATNVAIPYSSVWATIKKGSKIVFDERLWPMISRYMGPHYGNNVTLPSAGLYTVSLLVSPPVAARHLEYKGLWLKPHKVNLSFRWVPKSTSG
jgi:Fe2+ transport protein